MELMYYNSQNDLFCPMNNICCRVEYESVEEATNRILKFVINLSYLI